MVGRGLTWGGEVRGASELIWKTRREEFVHGDVRQEWPRPGTELSGTGRCGGCQGPQALFGSHFLRLFFFCSPPGDFGSCVFMPSQLFK